MNKIPMDLELRKAFTELQTKMVETKKKIMIIDTQLNGLNAMMVMTQLTFNEIEKIPESTPVYGSVGRMFLRTDLPVIKKELATRRAEITARHAEYEDTRDYLERNVEESQENVREMIGQARRRAELV